MKKISKENLLSLIVSYFAMLGFGSEAIINHRYSAGFRLFHGTKHPGSTALRWTYFLGGIQQIDAAKPRHILSDVG